jgi:hypothetical protein
MAKAALNKEKNIFTSKLQLILRKKLIQCYVQGKALYCAESGTLQKVDQIYVIWRVLKCGAGEGWRRSR